jgi:hypothetical protein
MPIAPTPRRIRFYLRKLEDALNTWEMMPATHSARNAVLLALLSKALYVSRAICTLVEKGFPAEAFAMSRTIFDIFFTVRYIGNKDTEARAEQFVKFHAKIREHWATSIIPKFYPNIRPDQIKLSPDVIEAAKEFKHKGHWTGEGGQAKLMALEGDPDELDANGNPVKDAFDYEALYYWTSQYVHVSVDALDAHATEAEQVFRVHSRKWVDEKRGNDALFNVVLVLCKIFARACRAMNEEQPEIVGKLFTEISNFVRQNQAQPSKPRRTRTKSKPSRGRSRRRAAKKR